MVDDLRRRLRGEPRERPRLSGPRRYQPHRLEGRLGWDDVRGLTLDEAARRARRHGHFVAIALVIFVVAVWFPGDLPVSRQLVPSGGFSAPATDHLDEQAAEVLGRQEAVPAPEASSAGTGSSGLAPGDDFEFDVGDLGDGVLDGGGSGRGGDAPDPGDRFTCAVDEPLPEPVVAPTLEQARAAQTALEEGVGQPFPVDVVSLAAPLCEAGAAGANGVDEVLTLGSLVPLDQPGLLVAVAPVVAPWCPAVTELALAEALATRSVSPALVRAAGLCVAAAEAAAELPTVVPAGDDLPEPTVPERPDAPDPTHSPDPAHSPDPTDSPIRPVWQSGSPIG